MFLADRPDVKIYFVLGLDRDIGTESVVAGRRCIRMLRHIVEYEDFFPILRILNPLQEIGQRLLTVDSLAKARYADI